MVDLEIRDIGEPRLLHNADLDVVWDAYFRNVHRIMNWKGDLMWRIEEGTMGWNVVGTTTE